jgi:hypothetical protein
MRVGYSAEACQYASAVLRQYLKIGIVAYYRHSPFVDHTKAMASGEARAKGTAGVLA